MKIWLCFRPESTTGDSGQFSVKRELSAWWKLPKTLPGCEAPGPSRNNENIWSCYSPQFTSEWVVAAARLSLHPPECSQEATRSWTAPLRICHHCSHRKWMLAMFHKRRVCWCETDLWWTRLSCQMCLFICLATHFPHWRGNVIMRWWLVLCWLVWCHFTLCNITTGCHDLITPDWWCIMHLFRWPLILYPVSLIQTWTEKSTGCGFKASYVLDLLLLNNNVSFHLTLLCSLFGCSAGCQIWISITCSLGPTMQKTRVIWDPWLFVASCATEQLS